MRQKGRVEVGFNSLAACHRRQRLARGGIRGIADLKGKRVGQLGGSDLISMMAAYVGLDPEGTLP
jgi:ABC-type nitrate/sulfonate/bicarbonate transport system substrate-binding protein